MFPENTCQGIQPISLVPKALFGNGIRSNKERSQTGV